MRAALLLALALVAGCAHTARLGDRDVKVTFADERNNKHKVWYTLRRIEREWGRAVKLDGPVLLFEVEEIIVWHRPILPFAWPANYVGFANLRGGKAVLHIAGPRPVKVLRHEMHHARSGPGHYGPKWAEIEKERFE